MTGGDVALVMSGGGARAAYQVGFLRALARRIPEFAPPILTGVSAGAINAAFLAGQTSSFAASVEALTRLWTTLTVDRVFHVDALRLGARVLRTGAKLVSGGVMAERRPYSLVDTTPLRRFLDIALHADEGALPGVAQNLALGRLRALAITASSYSTGQSVTFVQGQGATHWERADRRSIACEMRVEHVMASSALPLFFPAIAVDGSYYGDGGIRLTAPLSPAVHLGARRIVAISTRYGRSQEEAGQTLIDGYPPIAQMLGVLFNAVFLDLVDADALALQRINEIIDRMPPDQRGALRRVELLQLRPTRDLGKLASEYEAELPRAFRFFTRGLGTRQTRSNDVLSMMMFQPNYLT
ncbi:MAG: patatin-like phospholipase family protein, partial [Myxococcota bacterium]